MTSSTNASPGAGAASESSGGRLVELSGLRVSFRTPDGPAKAVDGMAFALDRGSTLAVVGESGSGKSVMGRTILGLNVESDCSVSGEIWFNGEQLVGLDPRRVRTLRGKAMAMIFQVPLSALHPFYRVGWQVSEGYRAKNRVSRKEARARAVEMFRRVGFADPERRVRNYPHQFSGGMR